MYQQRIPQSNWIPATTTAHSHPLYPHTDSAFPAHTPLIPISSWHGPPAEALISRYDSWQLCKRRRQISQEKAKWYFFNISSVCLWRSYTNILSSWYLSCTDRVQGQLWLFLPDSWCLTECSVTVKGARLAEALYELVSKVQRADRHIQALTNCFCFTYLQRCKISSLFVS